MKHKLFRLGLTVAMLAVLVESLGAPMKWGWSRAETEGTGDEGSPLPPRHDRHHACAPRAGARRGT